MFYYQSMHNKNFEEKRQKGKHLSNPLPFFANFLIESHYLDHFLFKQAFFCKNFFFFNTFLFLTCHHFFLHFSLNTQNIFFEENE